MAVRTEQEWIDAPAGQKQTRRITASGQVNNFKYPDTNENGDYVEDDGVTLIDVRYIDYLGKITRMLIDTTTNSGDQDAAAQFTRRFEGETEELVDPQVQENTASLSGASEAALKSATDACAAMGTLGSVAEEIAEPAEQAEQAATEMLSSVGEAAGICGEVVGEVSTVLSDIGTLISEANTLITQLEEAGETALAAQLQNAIDAAGNVTETCTNGLNVALGAEVPDIGAAVSEAVAQSEAAIAEAAATVGDMMKAVESGGCNAVAGALSSLPVTPPGEAGAVTESLQALRPEQTRYLTSEGQVVNFNIDRTKPYADIQYRGKLTRMHYANAGKMLERFGQLGTLGGLEVSK